MRFSFEMLQRTVARWVYPKVFAREAELNALQADINAVYFGFNEDIFPEVVATAAWLRRRSKTRRLSAQAQLVEKQLGLGMAGPFLLSMAQFRAYLTKMKSNPALLLSILKTDKTTY